MWIEFCLSLVSETELFVCCLQVSCSNLQIFQVLHLMIGWALIPGMRRKYPPYEYKSAVLLVVGLILFTLADAQASPNFSVISVLKIAGAFIMDSFLVNAPAVFFKSDPDMTQVYFTCFCIQFDA